VTPIRPSKRIASKHTQHNTTQHNIQLPLGHKQQSIIISSHSIAHSGSG